MSTLLETKPEARRASPLRQLMLARLREFWRQPEAVFWTYGFPLLMTVALGIAFRNKSADTYNVDVQAGPRAAAVAALLKKNDRLQVHINDAAECRLRLRTGRTELVVVPQPSAKPAYDYDYATRAGRKACWRAVRWTIPSSAGRAAKIRPRQSQCP